MEYSMRDLETAIAMNANSVVNVQQKKQFDLADVDHNEMKLENDDWNIDSIFPLNNDFLNDLGEINMNANWSDAYDYMSSPTSTGTGTESENDHDMLSMKPLTNQMLSPPQNLISSSSSDSGLSSDHVDFDMNFDQLSTDLLQQPLLSNQIIIPELVEPEPAQSPVLIQKKVEPNIVMTQQNNMSNIIETQNVPEFRAKPTNAAVVQIKNSENLQKRRVQIIKKMPSNIVQITDSNGMVKLNQAVSENIISNNPIVINKFNGNISGIRKVIQLKKSPNQKPIILPFTLKNGTDIRSIKIIKPSSLTKSPKILMAASNLLQEYKQNEMKQNAIFINKSIKVEPKYEIDSMSEPSDCESYKFEDMIVQDDDDDDDVDDYNNDSDQGVETDQQSEYPKLILSGEEKRLLAKEGIKLPAHYPLTKQEERELKRIRRKIRNKISAQDSRKRKKEYVDGLEERVKKCTNENQTLVKRIKLLQTQNQNLINQMKKMQNLLTKGGNKSVQPATCLMVLLMSMALIAAPNLKLNNKDNNIDEALTQELEMMENNNDIQQNRRALLFDTKEKFSDMGDMVADEEMGNDFNMLYDKSENEHNYAETQIKLSSNKIDNIVVDFDVDDTVWEPKVNSSRDLITPKVEPQLKNGNFIGADHIMKYNFNHIADNSEPMVTHSKLAQNLSDLPTNDEFRLKLSQIETNIIDLNTEIDAKNV